MWFFGVFSCLKTLFLDFYHENFLVTQIFKCFTVLHYIFKKQNKLKKKSCNNRTHIFDEL